MLLDDISREVCKRNKNAVVGFILLGSYIYYHKPHQSYLFTDTTFDAMCKFMLKHYDDIEHRLKHLITKEDLQAGTLFKLQDWQYPIQLIGLAIELSECEEYPDWLKGEY